MRRSFETGEARKSLGKNILERGFNVVKNLYGAQSEEGLRESLLSQSQEKKPESSMGISSSGVKNIESWILTTQQENYLKVINPFDKKFLKDNKMYLYKHDELQREVKDHMEEHFEAMFHSYLTTLRKECVEIAGKVTVELTDKMKNQDLENELKAVMVKSEKLAKTEELLKKGELAENWYAGELWYKFQIDCQNKYLERISQLYNDEKYKGDLKFILTNKQYIAKNMIDSIERECSLDDTLHAKLFRKCVSAPNELQDSVENYVIEDFESKFSAYLGDIKKENEAKKENITMKLSGEPLNSDFANQLRDIQKEAESLAKDDYIKELKKEYLEEYIERISQHHNGNDNKDNHDFKKYLDFIIDYRQFLRKGEREAVGPIILKCSMGDPVHANLLRPLRELKERLEERYTPIERLARGFSSRMWIEFIRPVKLQTPKSFIQAAGF